MQFETEKRKLDHIDIVLQRDVESKGVHTGFETFFFEHIALPEVDFNSVDLGVSLWNKKLKAPLLISSMTGGTEVARSINLCLAEVAQSLGIAMGVGSQRAAIEQGQLANTYKVRKVAPDILLFANFGAVQLNYGYGVDQARQSIDMIEADSLILHLNSLQEAVQPGGDRNWKNLYHRIETLTAALDVPVVVKEVGNGISMRVARRLADCGVAAIDIAGAGGTSWSEVEACRQTDPLFKNVAHSFAGWGIPTALSLIEVRKAVPELPIFASGGIRNGIEVAKAISLGATLVGSAAPLLQPATNQAHLLYEKFNILIKELHIAAFCTGSKDLEALRRARLYKAGTWKIVNKS